MNSKKKNKNRQNKPPNPTPPQKKESTQPVSPPEEIISSAVEERVPNIISENVPVEVKEPEGVPEKPKRNRGKNKKDSDKSDKEDEVLPEESAAKSEIIPVQHEVVDTDIAPTARKKKNIKKGNKEEPLEEGAIEVKVVATDIDQSASKHQEERVNEDTEKGTKSSKKKNKKKKNRTDSEKSEKEEVSCTSAFDTLHIENEKTRSDKLATTDDSSISEATVKEVEIATPSTLIDIKPQEHPQKDDTYKNKKKNKKDKKKTGDLPQLAENIREPEIMKTEEIITLSGSLERPSIKDNIETVSTEESHTSKLDADEKSPKPKAKIVKPVEKKETKKENYEKGLKENVDRDEAKNNIDEEPTATIVSLPVSDVPKPSAGPPPRADLLTSTTEASSLLGVGAAANAPSTSVEVDLLPFVTLDDSDLQANTSTTSHEEIKIEEGNGPLIGCEENIDLNLITQNGNQDKNKRRKKSPKPQRRSGTVVRPNISSQMLPENYVSSVINEENTSHLILSPTELKIDEQTTDESQIIPVPDDEIEHDVSAANNEKRQKVSKQQNSPKPQRKSQRSEVSSDPSQPAVSKVHEETKVEETISLEAAEYNTDVFIEESAVIKDETEHIEMPDHKNRQKGKKSPKPQIDSKIPSGSKGKTEKVNKNIINIDDIIIIQAEVVSDEKAKQDDVFVASELVNTEKPEDIDNINADISKQSTKKKKSSKPLQKEITKNKPAADVEVIESEAKIQMPITPKPNDIKFSSDVIPIQQEVSKVSTLPSPSDITPDFIEYPRSSSENLTDNNNNMVIQEISNADSKLTVPIVTPDTPFVQKADTEPNFSGIKVMDKDTDKKPTEEKTDLKSKVMEVNQDMEELRLSIERSLAELTSLDKIDNDNGKALEKDKKYNVDEAESEKTMSNIATQEKVSESMRKQDIAVESEQFHFQTVAGEPTSQEPICPERKDRKGKGKSKKKGKQDAASSSTAQSSSTVTDTKEPTQSQDVKKDDSDKSDKKTETTQEKGKQQSSEIKENTNDKENTNPDNVSDFEPIENFEDALTSSADDVNKTFEIIANEASPRLDISQNNPEINIIAPQEDSVSRQDKKTPVSPPKNLLGHPDIPVPSSKTDYKKEKNKTPNNRQAKVKIKDCNQVEIEIDKSKQSKESQTENKKKFSSSKNPNESICVTNKNEDYVYKYSFRKVFLQCACHVCKKDLAQTRVPCSFCNLIYYCSQKHKDEDYAQHQALCFAVSTIVHLKNQKFMYADALNVTGYNYRLLRMQAIVSCEKVLKRRLAPWEQEALLYPRICADPACREWRHGMLEDCEGCGQISYCSGSDHLPKSHARWCKSYNLYRSLVHHQQTRGRLEPKLPTRVVELSPLPDNINEVLAVMYEERIDINDIEYAALTQLATAPLTALYCLQAYNKTNSTVNGLTKKTLTLHIVGAELQFEADVLNKWEVFLLHLVPGVKELRVVLVGLDLNPSNLPLDLLGKIRFCNNCQLNKRRVIFVFQDKRTYYEFWASDDFTVPDLVCAFNPSIQRSSAYNGKDTWPSTISCILKQKTPFVITAYTISELTSDLLRIQECAGVGYSVVYPPKTNSFASVRPDRNFISDDEAPLLFKNQCVTVVCGV